MKRWCLRALPSGRRKPFDKSGSGPTSLQIGLQTPHEHNEKEHSNAQNEDQEQREKTFRVRPGGTVKRGQAFKRHILTKKTTKNKRHLRGAVNVHETNMGSIAQMLPSAGL